MVNLRIEVDQPDPQVVKTAANFLETGGVVVYPTDTAYGLGVDATNKQAVEKLYNLKGRKYTQPTHVIVADLEMMSRLVEVNEWARKLCEHFMPGPLTLVLPDKGMVDGRLSAGTGTLGVRIPDCGFTKELSRVFPRPYTTPSANR